MDKIEMIQKLFLEYMCNKLSLDDEMELRAFRRHMPFFKRAYRNWSGNQKILKMIVAFIDQRIWYEYLKEFLSNEESGYGRRAYLIRKITGNSN